MKQLTNWLKPQYIVTLAIIAGVILLLVKFKDFFKGFGNKRNEEEIPTGKTSKPKAELKQIANAQETAMGDIGTDELTLFRTLEGLNSEDLKTVFNEFGKRNYQFGMRGGNVIGNTLNLFEWYNSELSGKELEKMREIWKVTNLAF